MFTKICATVVAGVAGLLLSLAASGAPSYKIGVTIDPIGGGTVALDPLKSSYQKNNIVTLTAVPAAQHCFVSWSGDLSGTQNPITLRVSGNHTVTAHFGTGTACGGGGGSGGGGGGAERPPVPAPTGTLPANRMIVGYFAQWAIYRRN